MGQVLGSNLDKDIGYPEFFHGFIQSLQVNSMMVAQLGHGCFIPVIPNQLFINHPTIQCYTVQLLTAL
ncbi:hypothetical protein B7P43_G16900 [Cryptotermes secundus]|uniref:Uncharacterized protein n=1 Tax=Cryptotermes secundus TaxID=105785 RepID=A0A2J7QFS1_9NEOP|nr:hypothetical protein B7P43_G16900 [Cryptotermes secundus]